MGLRRKRPGVGGGGLAHVPTDKLVRVLRAVHRGALECPISHPGLLRAGLPDLVDELEHLAGLDARAVSAVIVAVIAERRAQMEEDAEPGFSA